MDNILFSLSRQQLDQHYYEKIRCTVHYRFITKTRNSDLIAILDYIPIIFGPRNCIYQYFTKSSGDQTHDIHSRHIQNDKKQCRTIATLSLKGSYYIGITIHIIEWNVKYVRESSALPRKYILHRIVLSLRECLAQ